MTNPVEGDENKPKGNSQSLSCDLKLEKFDSADSVVIGLKLEKLNSAESVTSGLKLLRRLLTSLENLVVAAGKNQWEESLQIVYDFYSKISSIDDPEICSFDSI